MLNALRHALLNRTLESGEILPIFLLTIRLNDDSESFLST